MPTNIYSFSENAVATGAIKAIIKNALSEDIGAGDLTTKLIATDEATRSRQGRARLIAKEEFILAGIGVFAAVFYLLNPAIAVSLNKRDGEKCAQGELIANLEGPLVSILAGERTALNLLQRMSGIASITREFVRAINDTGARILDTRKTAPNLRVLDKYAVKVGGGFNHRFALDDGILIKENHIALAGGITDVLNRVLAQSPKGMKVEIEVKNIAELRLALDAEAAIIMLDNMSIADMRQAVAINNGMALLEASGNISLANVRMVAETGVDFISVGALTHSVKAADISLLVDCSA
ncbi:MAG: carboxylating nicotinate-nucleotide diphosphorylase [Deltaproteobacteria bacterium]|nr:carboxylating nicotinate-nucleotide diphosphorylase [Deltaproteobacteria bacterium]